MKKITSILTKQMKRTNVKKKKKKKKIETKANFKLLNKHGLLFDNLYGLIVISDCGDGQGASP